MPKAEMRVELISHTPDVAELVALGAKLCYAGSDLTQLKDGIQAADQRQFITRLMDMGHLSVLEHASFTFLVEGISRACLAQLTRHRIASFSVQSQRYVSMEKRFTYVVPPSISALGEDAEKEYARQMEQTLQWYTEWQLKLGKGEHANEDARFVLPSACATRLMMTMNVRELLHFFSLRCCNRAQWEIRAMARKMLAQCWALCPALFDAAGPACVRGACAEGEKSCGQAAAVRREIEALKQAAQSQILA